MITTKEYNSDPMNEKVRMFEMELKKKFPDLRVTSSYRPRAFTKKGAVSRHAKGEAIDIEGRKDVYEYLWNTKEGISLMYNSGVGILDETTPEMLKKTGGTGAHYHIGMDSTIVPQMQERYNQLMQEEEIRTETDVKVNSEQRFLQSSFDLPNFATLPKVEEKEEPKKETAEDKLQEIQKEDNFLEMLKLSKQDNTILQQQQEQLYEAPQLNAEDFYNQANQIIGTPEYQRGGNIPIDSRGYWNKENEGSPVIIPSSNITMKGVPYKVKGTSLETGEEKVMFPNLNYYFSNTKNVLETPINE